MSIGECRVKTCTFSKHNDCVRFRKDVGHQSFATVNGNDCTCARLDELPHITEIPVAVVKKQAFVFFVAIQDNKTVFDLRCLVAEENKYETAKHQGRHRAKHHLPAPDSANAKHRSRDHKKPQCQPRQDEVGNRQSTMFPKIKKDWLVKHAGGERREAQSSEGTPHCWHSPAAIDECVE